MPASLSTARTYADYPPHFRWVQLGLMMLLMLAISTPGYVWALFVRPLQADMQVSLSGIQVTFAIFMFMQAGFGPIVGWAVERVPVRLAIITAGLLIIVGWIGAAYSQSLPALYLTYGLCGGLATGIVGIVSVGFVAQWFPDRRGLAIGLSSGAMGMGAVITTFPISATIQAYGHTQALLIFGTGIGVLCILVGMMMRRVESVAIPKSRQTVAAFGMDQRHYRPSEMLKTPVFWLLFVMMACIATSGLMIVSQLGAIAGDYGVDRMTVFGLAALPLALTVDRIMNGVTRPFFGWVSDRIGRPNTMALAFFLEAASVYCLYTFAHDPLLFVLISGVVMFGWGEIYSLFPASLSDYFGTKFSSANWGFLAVAIAISGILAAPLAALLREHYNSWGPVFHTVVVLDLCTVVLAYFVLKPMHARWTQSAKAPAAAAGGSPAHSTQA